MRRVLTVIIENPSKPIASSGRLTPPHNSRVVRRLTEGSMRWIARIPLVLYLGLVLACESKQGGRVAELQAQVN